MRKTIRELLVMTGATLIIAAAVFFFLVPSHAAVSSVSGLAIVLSNFVPLSVSGITMALNLILLAVGFLLCGHEFGFKTVYTSILLPVLLGIFEFLLSYTNAELSATSMPLIPMALPRSICRYLLSILATMSRPPEEAFILNKIPRPMLTVKI